MKVPTLAGHTNTLLDFVGPLGGAAKLTVFSEGNHFPVLTPLLFDDAALHSGDASLADDILLVTLPQRLLVDMLAAKRIRLGRAVLPIHPAATYPDIVMAGEAPLRTLAERGVIEPVAVPFARHRGLGLLVHRSCTVRSLAEALSHSELRLVFATEQEAGAREQYLRTIEALVGGDARRQAEDREIGAFPERLSIQHRDVPYALLQRHADVGIVFAHLAAHFAHAHPDELAFVPVAEAAAFGAWIGAAFVRDRTNALARRFWTYFLREARARYPAAGFSAPEEFPFAQAVPLLGS